MLKRIDVVGNPNIGVFVLSTELRQIITALNMEHLILS